MIEELTERVRRQERVDHNFTELDALSERVDAITQFVVVRQVVHYCFEAPDGLQITSAESQCRAQSEVEPFFHEPRAHHAGDKIGTDPERLEPRTQSRGGDASVQASHHSNR